MEEQMVVQQVQNVSWFQTKVQEVETAFVNLATESEKSQVVSLLKSTIERLQLLLQSVDSDTITHHQETPNGDDDGISLVCPTCNQVFTKAHFFKRHVEGHTRNCCTICSQAFSRRRALVIHMKDVHKVIEPETHYECSHCQRRFAKKPSLIAHLATHASREGKLACSKCGAFFSNEADLASHNEEHARACKFSCDKCHAVFRRRQQFDLHMEGHEKNRCGQCDEEFSHFKLLAQHSAKFHDLILQPRNNTSASSASAGLDQVEQLLRPGRPKKVQPDDWASSTDKEAGMCDRCGVLFSFRQALDKHRSSGNCVGVTEGSEGADEEEEETERCQECGERFTSRASLARHRQVHDVQRPFLCHCGRSYKRFRHLQAHLLQRHNTVIRETAVDAAVEVGANQETDAEQVE